MALRAARPIRIHCPVAAEALAAAVGGDLAAIERDPQIASILDLIRGDNALGGFGAYQGVCEIGFGAESFVPTEAANPVLGEAGIPALSPTIVLLTWVDADLPDDRLEQLIETIAERHPWEVPVIEIGAPVRLYAPGS